MSSPRVWSAKNHNPITSRTTPTMIVPSRPESYEWRTHDGGGHGWPDDGCAGGGASGGGVTGGGGGTGIAGEVPGSSSGVVGAGSIDASGSVEGSGSVESLGSVGSLGSADSSGSVRRSVM